jgi:hypothetical protein
MNSATFGVASSDHPMPAALVCAILIATTANAFDVAGGTTTYKNYQPPSSEIHVVGIYEAVSGSFGQHPLGSATIQVRYHEVTPMKPITLVLSSYEPVNWIIERDPGAAIEKIILNGFYSQSVSGAGSTPVLNLSGYSSSFGSYAYQWPLSTGGSDTQQLLANVEDYFGVRVSSFAGAYRANSFSITGSAVGGMNQNPRLGAGNLTDGASPDLLYDARTGEVRLDLTDLAARYPFGSGDIWWQHFDAQRLFVALANHDSSFNVAGFDSTDMESLGLFPEAPALNSNRLGYNGVLLRNWHGQAISLGKLLPSGMSSTELREYFAAAHYSTDQYSGDFDLVVTPAPEPCTSVLFTVCLGSIGVCRRRWNCRYDAS